MCAALRSAATPDDEEYLPTIIESSPRSERNNMLAGSNGSQALLASASFSSQLNILGSSWGSQGSLLQAGGSGHGEKSMLQRMQSGGSGHGSGHAGLGYADSLTSLEDLRDIMRRLKFTKCVLLLLPCGDALVEATLVLKQSPGCLAADRRWLSKHQLQSRQIETSARTKQF